MPARSELLHLCARLEPHFSDFGNVGKPIVVPRLLPCPKKTFGACLTVKSARPPSAVWPNHDLRFQHRSNRVFQRHVLKEYRLEIKLLGHLDKLLLVVGSITPISSGQENLS